MKRTFKLCLSLAGLFLALGVVCMVAGALMGGREDSDRYFRENWSGGHWNETLEHVGEAFGQAGLSGHHREPDHPGGNGGTYPIALDGLRVIEVDVDCADIEVREGESACVDLSWNLSNYAISQEMEEGRLKITSDSWGNSKLPDNFHIDCKVVLTLPAGTELEKLELSTDMGDVDVDAALTVKEADLSTDLGDVTSRSLQADDLNADTDLGDVKLHLPGERGDYYWELETSLGELFLDGEKQSGGLGELVHHGGVGKKQVEASSSLGNVELDFS